jgi:hypothetical protein
MMRTGWRGERQRASEDDDRQTQSKHYDTVRKGQKRPKKIRKAHFLHNQMAADIQAQYNDMHNAQNAMAWRMEEQSGVRNVGDDYAKNPGYRCYQATSWAHYGEFPRLLTTDNLQPPAAFGIADRFRQESRTGGATN